MTKWQVGDRFQRTGGDKVWRKQPQYDFTHGVIAALSIERSEGSGGCECGEAQCLTINVQFDDYDYRLDVWPNNCHTIALCIIDHEVTEQDVEAALASIKNAIH